MCVLLLSAKNRLHLDAESIPALAGRQVGEIRVTCSVLLFLP